MMYIIWALLSVSLFLMFVAICFKATGFVRQKLGLLASLFFVFGLLSAANNSGADENMVPNSNEVRRWDYFIEDSLDLRATFGSHISLEKTSLSEYRLNVKFGIDRFNGLIYPLSAYSVTSGFTIGTKWIPEAIIVSHTENNRIWHYIAQGTVKWKLLGTTIYHQPKSYTGVIVIK